MSIDTAIINMEKKSANVATWQKIDIDDIHYAEQAKTKIIDALTNGGDRFKDYLDKNFSNDIEKLKEQTNIRAYHSNDQKFVTRLFEVRVADYLSNIGAVFTETLEKDRLIENCKKENKVSKINHPDFLITLGGKKYFVEVTMPTRVMKKRTGFVAYGG